MIIMIAAGLRLSSIFSFLFIGIIVAWDVNIIIFDVINIIFDVINIISDVINIIFDVINIFTVVSIANMKMLSRQAGKNIFFL